MLYEVITLADRMRPTVLDEFAGQMHLLEAGKPLRRAIEQGRAHSMITEPPTITGSVVPSSVTIGMMPFRTVCLSYNFV